MTVYRSKVGSQQGVLTATKGVRSHWIADQQVLLTTTSEDETVTKGRRKKPGMTD
jgi:hypothetical protein